jgi:hypothetical protein
MTKYTFSKDFINHWNRKISKTSHNANINTDSNTFSSPPSYHSDESYKMKNPVSNKTSVSKKGGQKNTKPTKKRVYNSVNKKHTRKHK